MKQAFIAFFRSVQWDRETQRLGEHSIDNFIETLYGEAILVARRRNDKIVLPSHFIEALQITQDRIYQRKAVKEWIGVLGGAFLGAFISEFVTALANRNDVLVMVFVVWGLVGVSLLTWSFRR